MDFRRRGAGREQRRDARDGGRADPEVLTRTPVLEVQQRASDGAIIDLRERAAASSAATATPPTPRAGAPAHPRDDPWAEVVVDIPSPRFEPRPPRQDDYVPDTVADGWATASFVVRAASVRGASHRYAGLPRQDDMVVMTHAPTGAVIVAVGDGVSSAPEAHRGAHRATRAAVRALAAVLDEGPDAELDWHDICANVCAELVDEARDVMGSAAPPAGSAEALLGTTLIAAAITPHAEGARVRLAQVGDSTAWLLRSRRFRPLLRQKTLPGAAVVDSAVAPLPRVPETIPADDILLQRGDVLLFGTDGLGDPLGDGTGLVGQLLADELAVIPRAIRFTHLLDFSRETFDDDRTLVALWVDPRPLDRGSS